MQDLQNRKDRSSRPVYFVKYFDKGSTVMGGEQISEGLIARGIESRTIEDYLTVLIGGKQVRAACKFARKTLQRLPSHHLSRASRRVRSSGAENTEGAVWSSACNASRLRPRAL